MEHGKEYTYKKYKCRCDLCRAANSKARRVTSRNRKNRKQCHKCKLPTSRGFSLCDKHLEIGRIRTQIYDSIRRKW